MSVKRNIVFDFDGVINSYRSGWVSEDVIPDPPVEGIAEAIAEIRKDYNVIVVSTRAKTMLGRLAIRGYLKTHGIEVDGVQDTKPPAAVYIDDRGLTFDGDAASLPAKVRSFTPWLEKS